MLVEVIAYFDDSGHPDNQVAVGVAGFIAEKSQWLSLDREWRETLNHFGLPSFHMVDFEAGRGIYKGWATRRKDKLLNRLIDVIGAHTQDSLSEIVPMKDYRTVNDLYALEECLGTPYAMTGRGIAGKLNRWKALHNEREYRVLIYFEDGTKHKGDLIDVLRRDKFSCPGFLGKKEMCPLQAADLLAWEIFHALKTGRVRRSLQRLVPVSAPSRDEFHGIYTQPRLIEICQTLPVPLRSEPLSIAFHSSPKKARRRTIKPLHERGDA